MHRLALIVPLALAGCGDDAAARDAGLDGGGSDDAGIGPDANPPLLYVDFAITGCDPATAPDGGPPAPCRGGAPLDLSFVAVAPAAIGVYAWTFGDGQTSSQPAPVHRYELPGVYDVSLSVLGPGGNASVVKPDVVGIAASSLGRFCSDDAQCASDDCVCADGDCPPGVVDGFCSETCSLGSPCATGVCANLAPTAIPDPDDWQRSLCLLECSTGADCPGGLVCRELRDGASNGWVRACFPAGLLGDIGDSCTDETGARVHAKCTSGLCVAEGARGICGYACSSAPCPTSAACATFNGGVPSPTCVARCDGDTACDVDPWLACEAPGAGGKGFAVGEAAAPAGYCAPKRCLADPQCGPDGDCIAGFCGPN